MAEETDAKRVARDAGGRFVRGTCGGPGRPRGSRSRRIRVPELGTVEWFEWIVDEYRLACVWEEGRAASNRVGPGCCVVPVSVVDAVADAMREVRRRGRRRLVEELAAAVDMLILCARTDAAGRR